MKKITFTPEVEQKIVEYYLQPNSLLATAAFAKVKAVSIIKQILAKYNVELHSKELSVKLQQEKAHETFLEQYGSEYICNSDYTKKKRAETVKAKYNVDNVFQTNEVKNKIKQTLESLYGVTSPLKNPELKNKAILTSRIRYAADYYNQSATAKENYLAEYGLDAYTKTAEFKQKRINTLAANKTFNTSKLEEDFYLALQQLFGASDIHRQYKDNRYPFMCDFYIKSLDTFIELNFTWTHGGHRYLATKEDEQQQLATWQNKAHVSKFYANAIKTWTERDVQKFKIAEENNLNYLVAYNKTELNEIFKILETGK